MVLPPHADAASKEIFKVLSQSSNGSRRLKIKTLMRKFGFYRRTEENTAEITEILQKAGVALYPPILKLGDDYPLSLDDWIVLSIKKNEFEGLIDQQTPDYELAEQCNKDDWFEKIKTQNLRTEREVEAKFIIPLLARLGYSEDERYDDMPVPASEGSRRTYYRADFALFCNDYEDLKGQVILIVEAKKETQALTTINLRNALGQAKSYALWTGCDHLLITDGQYVEICNVSSNYLNKDRKLFECHRSHLKENFPKIHSLVGKKALAEHFLKKRRLAEELVSL